MACPELEFAHTHRGLWEINSTWQRWWNLGSDSRSAHSPVHRSDQGLIILKRAPVIPWIRNLRFLFALESLSSGGRVVCPAPRADGSLPKFPSGAACIGTARLRLRKSLVIDSASAIICVDPWPRLGATNKMKFWIRVNPDQGNR